MIERIMPSAVPADNTLLKSKKQRGAAFSYSFADSDVISETNRGIVNVNEEYEKLISESAGIRASVFSEPTYSVSEDQAEYLSQKYDFENMPQYSTQEQEFLNELVSMDIISDEDAKMFNLNCGGSVESVTSYVSVVPLSSSPVPMWEDCFNDYDNIIDRLTAVIQTQKNISAYYKDKCADKENARKCDLIGLEASEDFLNSKQKILAVLQKIVP